MARSSTRSAAGASRRSPPTSSKSEFVRAFRGVTPNEKRFLGGETIGELFDRVIPAVDRLLADETWDTVLLVLHGAVNRAIISHALTGQRMFLGQFEQAPGCVNILDVGDEWIVRAVNVSPIGPRTPLHAHDDDGALLGAVPAAARLKGRSRARFGPRTPPL